MSRMRVVRRLLVVRVDRPPNSQMDPFSTHQVPLVAAMLKTQGPILELGAGWYSTPLISVFANVQKREACTVETNDAFLRLLAHYASPYHELRFMSGFEFDEGTGTFIPGHHTPKRPEYVDCQARFLNSFGGRQWAVVLIDQRPGFLRAPAIQRFAELAEFIVVHDTEDDRYGYEPTLSTFRYRYDFQALGPATTVVSNFSSCLSLIPRQ